MESVTAFDNSVFILMNKDTPLMKFRYSIGPLGGENFEEVEAFSEQKPIGFSNIGNFVAGRRAPKNRSNIENLLITCGCDTLFGFLNVTYALSLNDTFWVKPEDSQLQWDQVSLYAHDFNEEIARIAFEGGLFGLQFSSTSPEYGTNGMFAKCWHKNSYNGVIELLKRGTSGAANAGLEPYSEFYASQVEEALGLLHVKYDLKKFRGHLVCSCELFTSEKIGYAPIVNVLGNKFTETELIDYYKSIGDEEQFKLMLISDALTVNIDRHAGNYGILFDNDTLECLGMAPVFDNNMALLPYAMSDDFEDVDAYLKTRTPSIGADFVNTARLVLTPTSRKRLINMKGFQFKKHPEYNLPDSRLEVLEHVVNKQIDRILSK